MKQIRSGLILFVVLFALQTANAYAGSSQADNTLSQRSSKKLGMYLAVHDPSPTLLGVNVAYNITDFLRASAGYGKLTAAIGTFEASTTTFGFGLKGMMPGWNLTPTIGLHFATVSYSGTGIEVGGFTEGGSHLYGTLGFDWQTESGFSLNGGFRQSFRSGIGGGIYLGAGWFVDWLG